jgi:glycosyltransferase involved in cell wall biosynthesis
MKSGVSVIICCYNSEKRIEEVLHHLDKQKDTNHFLWEIILVDNASTDNTAEIARNTWTRKDVDLKVV